MLTKKVKPYCFIIIISFLCIKQEAVTQKNEPLAKFRAQHEVTKVFLDSNGVPWLLDGKLTTKGLKGNPEELTFSFFEENKDLYKMQIPADELKIKSVSKGPMNKTHIRLAQFYKGIEVYGSELITHFTNTNELESVNGEFLPGISISVTPTITQEAAEKTMMDDLRVKYKTAQAEVRTKNLLIYPFENKIYLAWLFDVAFQPRGSGRWIYFIDAANGDIIYKADTRRHGRINSNDQDTGKKVQDLNKERNYHL